MNKTVTIVAILLVLAALGAASAQAFTGFPYNGGFETVESGLPAGWDPTGTWLYGMGPAAEGRKFICLYDTVSRSGDRLVSRGYRLVSPGSTVVLSGSYQSPTGGALLGLVLCDALGKALSETAAEPLPVATAWTPISRTFALPAGSVPENLGAVRIFLSVTAPGQGACYDDLRLTVENAVCTPGLCVPARMNALLRPNLLPSGLLTSGETTPLGWSPLATAGSCPAWVSDRVPVDVSLPYEVSVQPAGDVKLLARVCDPLDPANVWLQTPATEGGLLALSKLSRTRDTGFLEIAVLPQSPLAGSLQVALRPQPLSLSVRPVAMAGEFASAADVQLFITAVNNTNVNLLPTAHLKVVDATGAQVCYEPRKLKINAQSAAYFPLKPKLPPGPGDYALMVRILDSGRDLGFITFPFKVASPVPVAPPAPVATP